MPAGAVAAVTIVSGWAWLSTWSTLTNTDSGPNRSPSVAPSWCVGSVSRRPYRSDCCRFIAAVAVASSRSGVRVVMLTTAPIELPGYCAENGP